MGNSLRKLFALAVVAAIGLFCLQSWWISAGWKNSRDIIGRQLDYSLQAAVDKEYSARHDSLYNQLCRLMIDSAHVGIRAETDSFTGKWRIYVFDTQNPGKTKVSWVEMKMDQPPGTDSNELKRIAYGHLKANIKKQVADHTVIFYTQRFGTEWRRLSAGLPVDTVLLQRLLDAELRDKNINAVFQIHYIDTAKPVRLPQERNVLFTTQKAISYSSVYESEHTHAVVAELRSPAWLVLRKLWIVMAATLLLVALTVFCLYRMYKAILQQKQLNDIKNDFIGNMTHELKTPIATISAAIEALQYFDAMTDEKKRTKYLETSRKELSRLNDIVSKVMELSLYETGTIRLQKQPVAVRELFLSVLDHINLQQERPVRLQEDAGGEEAIIPADDTHLSNIFFNLIENAVKYVPNPELFFSLSVENDKVSICIRDNGPGINAVHLPFLFDKFYRIPSGNLHQVKGFGLGLYYVKKIVEAHGGTIAVQSDRNGTSFTLQFPRA